MNKIIKQSRSLGAQPARPRLLASRPDGRTTGQATGLGQAFYEVGMKRWLATCLPGCKDSCCQLNVQLTLIHPWLTHINWPHFFALYCFHICILVLSHILARSAQSTSSCHIIFSPKLLLHLCPCFGTYHFFQLSAQKCRIPSCQYKISALGLQRIVTFSSLFVFNWTSSLSEGWTASTFGGWTARWTPAAQPPPWSRQCAGWTAWKWKWFSKTTQSYFCQKKNRNKLSLYPL